MFGFARKFIEKSKVDGQKSNEAVIDDMGKLLSHVITEIATDNGWLEDPTNPNVGMLFDKMRRITFGFEAIRDEGYATGFSDPVTEGAAKLAFGACSRANLTGKINNEKIVAELRHLLGFPRAGSKLFAN